MLYDITSILMTVVILLQVEQGNIEYKVTDTLVMWRVLLSLYVYAVKVVKPVVIPIRASGDADEMEVKGGSW